jgi:hypothetical protein
MAGILVSDVSPELEASLNAYATRKGLSPSQAAAELLKQSLESASMDEKPVEGVHVGDYLVETLKEALHTTDEADQFIHSRDSSGKKPVAS